MILSAPELLVLLAIVALMALECCLALRSRSWVQVYRPTLFVAVILAFYVLVGPLRAILSAGEAANFIGTSGTIYRNLDHRPFLIWGWLGALVFYACLLIGFHGFRCNLKPQRWIAKTNLVQINRWGQLLCFAGLLPYLLINGGFLFNRLNPLTLAEAAQPLLNWQGVNAGPFSNYFVLAINLLIPGIVVQFAVWLRRRRRLWVVLLWLLIAMLIFLLEAFRYRILLIAVPLLLLWFFYCKRRPMLVMLLVFMIAFVGINGAIGVARTSKGPGEGVRGFDLAQVASRTPAELFIASFEESGAFFTTSALIQEVPSRFPYIGLEPLVTAIAQPIPRAIFPGKPKGAYPSELPDQIYTGGAWKSHAAFLGYGEYYLIYGWPSIVVCSLVLGAALKWLWTWFLWRQYEPLAQSTYLLNASYLFIVVSRGYLSQVLMLYGFTVFPLFVVYCLISRPGKGLDGGNGGEIVIAK